MPARRETSPSHFRPARVSFAGETDAKNVMPTSFSGSCQPVRNEGSANFLIPHRHGVCLPSRANFSLPPYCPFLSLSRALIRLLRDIVPVCGKTKARGSAKNEATSLPPPSPPPLAAAVPWFHRNSLSLSLSL